MAKTLVGWRMAVAYGESAGQWPISAMLSGDHLASGSATEAVRWRRNLASKWHHQWLVMAAWLIGVGYRVVRIINVESNESGNGINGGGNNRLFS